MLKLKRIIVAYLPAFLWASLIFYLSNQQVLPSFDLSVLDFLFKKLAHITVYAILYFLLFYGTQKSWQKKHTPEIVFWALPLVISFIYATSDELHQSLVPGRHATIRDIAYDMLGACLVMLNKLGYI